MRTLRAGLEGGCLLQRARGWDGEFADVFRVREERVVGDGARGGGGAGGGRGEEGGAGGGEEGEEGG